MFVFLIVIIIWIKSVWYGCLIFEGIKFSWISLGVLSMIIYKGLYTWCLRYNICSATFLDIRISTCFVPFFTQRTTMYMWPGLGKQVLSTRKIWPDFESLKYGNFLSVLSVLYLKCYHICRNPWEIQWN